MAWLDGHTRNEEDSVSALVMATTPKPTIEAGVALADVRLPLWPLSRTAPQQSYESTPHDGLEKRPSGRDALQALLAFSALHQQVRQRRALASRFNGFDTIAQSTEFEAGEQFVLV